MLEKEAAKQMYIASLGGETENGLNQGQVQGEVGWAAVPAGCPAGAVQHTPRARTWSRRRSTARGMGPTAGTNRN